MYFLVFYVLRVYNFEKVVAKELVTLLTEIQLIEMATTSIQMITTTKEQKTNDI